MNIYESITAAMADIGAVGKTKWNDQQKFKFRGIDDVMNSLHPVLEKNKIFIVPEVLEQNREERTSIKRDNNGNEKKSTLIYSICKIKYSFYAEDGSFITAVVVGEGMDSGDKATNKAMSIAFKYALFQIFCIPTEEMQDPDSESPEPAPKGKGGKSSKADQKPQGQQNPPAQQQQAPPAEQQPETPAPAPAVQPTDIVDAKQVELLRGVFKEKGIDEAFVCKLYKMENLESATQSKYTNMMKNLDNIKIRQEGKK